MTFARKTVDHVRSFKKCPWFRVGDKFPPAKNAYEPATEQTRSLFGPALPSRRTFVRKTQGLEKSLVATPRVFL